MNFEFPIYRFLTRPFLWLSQFFYDKNFVVVCKGYGDDWKLYTGLDWDEDKDNDFCEYEDFKVWVGV